MTTFMLNKPPYVDATHPLDSFLLAFVSWASSTHFYLDKSFPDSSTPILLRFDDVNETDLCQFQDCHCHPL